MITGFVFIMMLLIEYINVQTKGMWRDVIAGNKWKQYIFAAIMGAIPGCLGAFTIVAMFSHRLISFGAIVATMIATSGDEAFVMFAMFPKVATILTLIILIIGIIAGYITDRIYVPTRIIEHFAENSFPIHDNEQCKCFQKDKLFSQLLSPTIYRLLLIIFALTFLILISKGILGGDAKHWIKTTVLFGISFSLFIILSVPDHFLKHHVWEHIVKMHVPRILGWTFVILLVFSIVMNYINIEEWISDNMFVVLIVAVLIGLIPESGPHFIFVTLFAEGSIPFSILLANSISQDGHGMLPMLAESKQGFVSVKIINIIVALIAGTTGILFDF